MIKGAIFDLDGTLLDSMSMWDTFGEDYLRLLGKEPRENLAEVFKTFTLEQSAEYYRAHYGVTLSVSEIIQGVNQMIEGYYINEAELKKGADVFLKKLYDSGVRMCVATVTNRYLAEAALERLGIRRYFSEIFTTAEVGHDKTSPHIYRTALAHLGTEKSETVVFEDAYHALMTAKRDGFPVAAVYDRHENRRIEMKAAADYYVSDYERFAWNKAVRTALTIAGSDSSGGAGIQADIKTMTMNGIFAMSAVTALTAQNTVGVRSIMEVTPAFLSQQIDAVFEDIRPNAVKIGMVSSAELIAVIAERLAYYRAENIVVDPVMVATSGSALMRSGAISALTEQLLPLSVLVTPNIPEAEVLSGMSVHTKEDMLAVAKAIGDAYGCAVLLKGGHSVNDANDLLYMGGAYEWFCGKRIDNPNTHGTGCTLSSAIAANLAKGYDLKTSIQRAKDYISGALAAMLDLGEGSGPMDHGFLLRKSNLEFK